MSQAITVRLQSLAQAKGGQCMFPEFIGHPIKNAEPQTFGILEGGMQSGATSVGMHLRLDDGTLVFFQMSAPMFRQLADALTGAELRWATARGGKG